MDKAPDFGSGDCRFESCHDRIFYVNVNFDTSFQHNWTAIAMNIISSEIASLCYISDQLSTDVVKLEKRSRTNNEQKQIKAVLSFNFSPPYKQDQNDQ